MPRKVFAPTLTPDQAGSYDPVIFALTGHLLAGYHEGRVVYGDEWTSRDFHCLPDLPAGALDDLTQTTMEGPNGTTYHVPSVIGFLRACIIDPERDEFDAIIRAKDKLIGNDVLVEAMQYVTEELSGGRPTRR
jgi:hypothetical protein